MFCVFGQCKTDRVIGRRVAGVQRGDDINLIGQGARMRRFFNRDVEKTHAFKAKPGGQFA